MKVAFIPFMQQLLDGELFQGKYNLTEPYGCDGTAFNQLKKRLSERGFESYTIDEIEIKEIDICIMIDINYYYLYELKSLDEPPTIIYLMREPPTVVQFNTVSNIKRYEKVFDAVITWNPELANLSDHFYRYRLPYLHTQSNLQGAPFDERSLLCNISRRKYSAHPNELYSTREDLIHYFDKNHPQKFGLYGIGWDSGPTIFQSRNKGIFRNQSYETYQGAVQSKNEVYNKYKFAVSIENISNTSGYLTEKIFDSIRLGITPIYYGARDVEEYIPEKLYIRYNTYSGPSELYHTLMNYDESDYHEFLTRAESFLQSNRASLHRPSHFAERICDIINNVQSRPNDNIPSHLDREIQSLASVDRIRWKSDQMSILSRFQFYLKTMIENPSHIISNPMLIRNLF